MQKNLKSDISWFWKSHKLVTIGWLAIVANLIFVLFFFHARNNYHIDELWSFVSANNVHPKAFYEYVWYPGSLLHNCFTVQPNETFSYGPIFENLAEDPHPPLYFILLHTICSFTPDVLSKWQGAVLNIPFWLLLLWMLFRLARCFFKDSFYAWGVVLLYAYSEVGIDTALFMRGYLLQTLFSVCLVYHVTRLLQENKASGWRWVCIGVFATLGMLTHYNSLMFTAWVGVVAGIVLCTRKEWKLCWRLGLTLVASACLFILLFPTSIEVLTNSYRAKEALTHYEGNFIRNFLYEMDGKELISGYLTRFLHGLEFHWFCFYILALTVLAYKYIRTKQDRLIDWLLCLIVFVWIYCAFSMPEMGVYEIRYSMFVYPLVAVVTVWYLVWLIKSFVHQPKERWTKWLIGLLILVNSWNVWSFDNTSPFAFRTSIPFPLQNLANKRIIVQGDLSVLWVGLFSPAKEVYWIPLGAPLEKFSDALKSADVLTRRREETQLADQLSRLQTNEFMDPALQEDLLWKRTFRLGFWLYDEYAIIKKPLTVQENKKA